MKRYTIKRTEVRGGILHLSLEPKRTRDRFKFYPGQYAVIGFSTPNGRRSPMRCFSITSSLGGNDLQFGIRVGGRFTNTLKDLPVGTGMFVQGPFGNFVIDKGDSNVVMLAGGIGITPFMSMVRSLTHEESSLPVTLLYSYRTWKDMPFRQELKSLKQLNPKLRVFSFITDELSVPEKEANVLKGMIKNEHIKQVTSGKFAQSTYFLCGPKPFMESMESLLKDNGVQEDRIITESFTQSSKVYFGSGLSVQRMTYAFASALLVVGIVGVSYIDLSRYIPRAQADTISGVTKITPSNSTDDSSSSSSSVSEPTPSNSSTVSEPTQSSSSSQSASTDNTSSNSGSSSNNRVNQTQTYQAPVTSVS